MEHRKMKKDLEDLGVTKLGMPLGLKAYEALLPIVESLEAEMLTDGDIENFLNRITRAIVYRNPKAAFERFMRVKEQTSSGPTRKGPKKTKGV